MSSPRIPPIKRFFQLQIPQRFPPPRTSVLAKTMGHMNLEGPAVGLTAVAYWARFSRWCSTHPTPGARNGKDGKGRDWLYRLVMEQEALDQQPINYLEFGVYRGDSLRLWVAGISHPDSRFIGFDTFTGLPERWRPTEPAGHFNANGAIPDIKDPRCSFEVGLFQDTLPTFVFRTDLTGRM